MFSSSDAYMLMYILRQSKHGEKSSVELFGNKIFPDDASLPSYPYEEIKQFNASYMNSCKQYKLKKEIEFNTITQQRQKERQKVRLVLSEAPVQSPEECLQKRMCPKGYAKD